MDHHNPNPNGPNLTKSAMAMHFMQALTNIQQRPTSPVGRSWRIKRAAYTSMVVATGLTRAWSQAVLRRLHGGRRRVRTLQRVPLPQRRIRVRVRVRVPIRASNNRIERLRRLVPGGRAMELGNLLEETASYVQCLRDQVTIMKNIVDSSVNNNL